MPRSRERWDISKKNFVVHRFEDVPDKAEPIIHGEGWYRWMGSHGNGTASSLPSKWTKPERIWRTNLESNGVAGITASPDAVVVSSRDVADEKDVFQLLDPETGSVLWSFSYLSKLNLDYGNSPRTASLLIDDYVITLGAGGQLHCLELISGKVRWKKHLVDDLSGRMPQWGYTSSPIHYKDSLIVQPGGLESAFVALSLEDGEPQWKAKGRTAAYACPAAFRYAGVDQWVGYDATTLGAWSLQNGKRLWEIKPQYDRDFNVPSPLLFDNKVFVVTENNGARLYELPRDADGTVPPRLIAQSDLLAHDCNSPIRVKEWIVGIDQAVIALDPAKGLAQHAIWEDDAISGNCSMITDGERILVTNTKGVCILLRLTDKGFDELGRFQPENWQGDTLAYPAWTDDVLFLRGASWIDAYRW